MKNTLAKISAALFTAAVVAAGIGVTGMAAPIAGAGFLTGGIIKNIGETKVGTTAGATASITSAMETTNVTKLIKAVENIENSDEIISTLETYRVGSSENGEGSALSLATDALIAQTEAAAAEAVPDEMKEASDTVEEAEETGNFANICVAQVNDYVNVRDCGSEDGEILGKLYDKSVGVVLDETEDGWYKISSGDVEGYVKAEYVVVGNYDLIQEVCRKVATVTTETLYIREAPSQDAPVMGMLPIEDDLTVTDESFKDIGWVGVNCEEGDGFVSIDFVSFSIEFVKAESKEAEEARLKKEAEERAKANAQAAASGAAKVSGTSAPGSSMGAQVANYGLQFVGNPYVYGGTSLTNGADCSGFVMSVYAHFGVSLPHSSAADRSVGYAVSADAIAPGDIVCYSGHVAIYIGNGQIVHASTAATGIKVSSWNYRECLAIRRIF